MSYGNEAEMPTQEQIDRGQHELRQKQEYEQINKLNMNDLVTVGIIKEILPTETGTSKAGKEWKKLNFVLNTGDKFNPDICFQIFGSEKCDNFVKYNKVGDEVRVSFNVYSREWKGKYFHNIDAWRVEIIAKDELRDEPVPTQDNEDDLPF